MNIKSFFGDALGQALELGVGTPDDVLRHVTPDVLAAHLPRPLWARLLTACVGAPKVDAQLVVETIGVANLCEHMPAHIIWACIAEIGVRAIGRAAVTTAAPPILTRASLTPIGGSVLVPPPPPPPSALPAPSAIEAPAATASAAATSGGPVNQPLADLITELEADGRPITPQRPRTPSAQRFRQSNTGIGRLGAGGSQARRPMASAAAPPIAPVTRPRRTGTDVEDAETETGGEWRSREIAVDDSQLVDWQSTETTQASTDDDFGDLRGRKR